MEIIKTCKIHGGLTVVQIYKNRKCIICSKEYAKNWAKENKEIRNITVKIWKSNNKDKVKIYRDRYKENNHDHKIMKDREYGKNYYKRKRDERNSISKQKKKKERDNLHATYLKTRLGRKFKEKASLIPLWMTEIQKPILLLKRKIREIKNGN